MQIYFKVFDELQTQTVKSCVYSILRLLRVVFVKGALGNYTCANNFMELSEFSPEISSENVRRIGEFLNCATPLTTTSATHIYRIGNNLS